MFKRVDHVVIAVSDLEASAALYQEKFELKSDEITETPALGIRSIKLDVNNAYVELAQPTDETGPVGRFLKERGEGLYLIALQVDDLKGTAKALRENGATIIGDESADSLLFIHPKSAHGALIQLRE